MVSGETMGTTYHITYQDSLGRILKKEIDELLVDINQGVSTYISDSDISFFNQKKSVFPNKDFDTHFIRNFFFSQEIYKKTDGYFDPTVMPLVNYWGFGYKSKKPVTQIDSVKVDSLKQLVGMDKINVLGRKGYKGHLIFYDLLERKNIENFLVEIGGEIRCKGKNPKGKLWTTAINTPEINSKLTDYEAIIKVDNKAVASSGNYRNFHQVNGEWYGHEINPKTGFPEKSKLLSVTVLTDKCSHADAYATGFMVMGLEKSKALVDQLERVDAFFIFANEKGELEQNYSKGFENIIVK